MVFAVIMTHKDLVIAIIKILCLLIIKRVVNKRDQICSFVNLIDLSLILFRHFFCLKGSLSTTPYDKEVY